MALPKNKNIRKIMVNDIEYYWTISYDEDYGLITCNVGLVDKPNYRFNFSRGGDKTHIQYIHNSIEEKDTLKAITPNLVRKAIEYANENLDWKNTKNSSLSSNSDGFNC